MTNDQAEKMVRGFYYGMRAMGANCEWINLSEYDTGYVHISIREFNDNSTVYTHEFFHNEDERSVWHELWCGDKKLKVKVYGMD